MSTQPSTGGAPLQSINLIARQAIVDARRSIVAYELFDRSTHDHAHDAGSDISLLFNAMADTSNALGVQTKTLFINRTHHSLVGDHLDLATPEKFVIEVDPVMGHEPEAIAKLHTTLAELHERGFKLAFDHTVVAPAYKDWQTLAHYVKLDMQAVPADMHKPLAAAIKAHTQAMLVAEKIETETQFADAVALGAQLFQGYWIDRPEIIKTKVVTPAHASVLQLFNLVRTQAGVDEIEALLKRDAMLGFNLMRLINSAGFGLTQEITSFRHAVMLIGMKRLLRWAALLLTASRTSEAAAVVGANAVVRGRMMELLGAGTLSAEDCESAFVVGLFSLLDDMLGVPMADALQLLTLPAPISDAILNGTGVLGRMLALTRAAESYDDASFANLATELNYSSHQINMAHMDALVWADSIGI
ncbi:MAG: HDOD domain-containing protein [Rhodoferax sp.]|nr:HDOD domain-containing protein [Rhodoferax sp.]